MNNKPLITIITPTFNSEKTILDNINSISDKTILRTFNDLKKNFKKVRH